MKCPMCNEDIQDDLDQCDCGYRRPKKKVIREETRQVREQYLEAGPTSWDLTDQQWFNVCKFFPTVAARCKRPPADLSPDNPMHKVRPGPMLQSMLGRTPVAERQPGEDDL